MNKSIIKTAPNAEQVPGSPESARVKNKNRDNIPHINLEKNDFWADPQMIKGRVPIVTTDPNTGRETVKVEEREFEAANDQNYRPSKSAKKRMRKRRISDENRARCEVVIHGLKETIDEDNSKLYWLREAEKFIDFTDELSPDYLDKDGIELSLEDIEVTNRILVWTDENNPLPMVVQLKDENTANAVKKAMFAAGCYNRRVHVKRGKYQKTGVNKTDKQKAEIIESLKGCYGRPSTTKAERDAARRKKEYLASQDFQKKSTFQELKERREVKFAYTRANYTIDKSKGTRALIKKPKTGSKFTPENRNEFSENNEEFIENFDPLTHVWFKGDYCRVICDFDGLEHEAKIIDYNYRDPNLYKVLILGYGKKEIKNVSNFKQTRGQKVRLAQYEVKNNKAILESIEKIKEGSEKVEEIPEETEDQSNKPSEDIPTESGSEFVHVSEDTLKMKDERIEEDVLEVKNSELNEVDKTIINKNSDANNNLNNSNLNNSLDEIEIDPEEVSELRDDGNNLLDNEADSTINLPSNNSSLLPCNGFATIDFGNIILKSIASIEDNDEPNLGDFVNDLDTELSEKEKTKNPPDL